MKDIAGCDWVIEVVVERLDIKQKVFEQVENTESPEHLLLPIHPGFRFT